MKTEIKKEGDTIVVFMDGYLDFETQIPLTRALGVFFADSPWTGQWTLPWTPVSRPFYKKVF